MAKIIPLSFKKDEEWLYQEIVKHSSHTGFIKECIIFYLNQDTLKTETKKPLDRGVELSEFDSLIESL